MREISLRAGNTVVASALVIVVFFAAAALGNLWGSRIVGPSARPLLFYGRFEVASGLAAIATFGISQWIWTHLSALPPGLIGQIPATLLLVGPPSLLAGVAFPSLAETFVPNPEHRTTSAGPLYGMNLLGAAIGVAAGGVLLPWWLGVKAAFAVAATLQILAGIIAWLIAKRGPTRVEAPVPKNSSLPKTASAPQLPFLLGWTLLAISGVLSLATQGLLIVWARQILQGSVYAISGVLAVFIGGLGLGALGAAKLRKNGWTPTELIALFAGLSALLLFLAPIAGQQLVNRQMEFASQTPIWMLDEALVWSALWLLPLTFCLGGVFPVAWELARSGASHEGRVLGMALALNKLGSATGSVAGLFLLLPLLGLIRGTFCIGWGYLLLAGTMVFFAGKLRPRSVVFMAAIAALGIWQTARPQSTLGLKPDCRLIANYSSAYGPVSVVERGDTGSQLILLNSRQYLSGTRRALSSQHHQSWVPLLLCRKPDRVVTIGMAAGISAASALDFPLKELYSVELVPEVVRAAREHFSPWNAKLFSDPRSKVILGDGRIVLAQLPGQFDAIICDLFFPCEDGTANLYSLEFFQNARSRLSHGGVFCLWLPCYQHDAETAGIVVQTFQAVFPNAIIVRANLDPTQPVIGLVGSNEPIPMSREFLAGQIDSPTGHAIAQQSPFFRSPENASLLFVGDLHAKDTGFADCATTTDDHPLLAFLGPRRPVQPLVGIPFLNWIGRRFLQLPYPSCAVGGWQSQKLLSSVRAGNFYFAAAVFESVVKGDKRPDEVRIRQVTNALGTAHSMRPDADIPEEALGQ